MMMPNTAARLRENKANTLKDFVDVAGSLGVTHFLMLTSPKLRSAAGGGQGRPKNTHYLKVCAAPRGPTLTFSIESYSLMSDVRVRQARPRDHTNAMKVAPLVVLSGFGSSTNPGGGNNDHLKLVSIVLQNLFPTINVQSLKMSTCKRVVLFVRENPGENEDGSKKNGDRVTMRHYEVTLRPTDVHGGFRALTDMSSSVPDLSKFADMSDWVTSGDAGYASDSDAEGETRVEVAEGARGKGGPGSCKVRLQEIGPRLNLRLHKVEDGLCDGEVLFHDVVTKSAEEAEATRKRVDDKKALRTQRRLEQEANVRRKLKMKEEQEKAKRDQKALDAKRKGLGKKVKNMELLKESKRNGSSGMSGHNDDDDDDAEYYRQEVGEDPDEEFKKAVRIRTKAGSDNRGARDGQKKEKRRPEWITAARERQKRRRAAADGGTGGSAGARAYAYNSD